MLKIRLATIAATIATALTLGWATAQATTYGNPAPNINKGDLSPGIALSDDREELYLDWGLSEPGTLRFILGAVDLGNDNGTEIGVGYRHKITKRPQVGDAELRLGGLVVYRFGEADNTPGLEYNQLDLGFGGATSIADNLDVYGIAIYRRVELNSKSNSDVGVALGAEFALGDSLLVGGELHLAIENDDFGFYAQIKF